MKMVSHNNLRASSVSPAMPTLGLSNSFATRIFSEIAEDITVVVDGESFLLHKFPLVAKCGKIRGMVGKDVNLSTLELAGFPGGVPTFELTMKFCYGINFPITTTNVAQLYCAAEYLEMTEEYKEDNLIARTEVFLSNVVLQSLESSVEVLTMCRDSLGRIAEEAGIVERCVEAIASNALKEQLVSGLSRLEYDGNRSVSPEIESTFPDWWVEDLLMLPIDFFKRVVRAMEKTAVRQGSIVVLVIRYAQSSLKDFDRSQSGNTSETEQRMVVETLVSLLPSSEKSSWVPLGFLFGMLKIAMALGSDVACRLELEKRIASHLEMAMLDDLLIPSVPASESLFDVDCIHRILVNFLQQIDEDERNACGNNDHNTLSSPCHGSLLKVGCLVDAYLAKIAADPYLSFHKFCALIELVPDYFRVMDDSLYRAIDVYLKAHPMLTEHECNKLCKFVDCDKLSEEACHHAAQNDRLPVQMIVRVLYAEQVRLKNSFSGSSGEGFVSQKFSSGIPSASMSPRDNYASLRRENRELKLEISRMRVRLSELEKEQMLIKQRTMDKSANGGTILGSISRGFRMFSSQKGRGNRPKSTNKSRSCRSRRN
ncbi:hypothetical protein MLD38_023945 [Melastoma candidum]|uniref:Uncharacterized protein n=1 Tax=Melastoma candidum TaxID=119954 RepID=A0ACB9NTF4_9MYRT|nr:hypothetical protein MLD38_023945 [Melastoma candidum]